MNQVNIAQSQPPSDGQSQHIALIDIGSNSVRLVVYRDYSHYPFPVLNERVTCKLGQGLDETRMLNSERMDSTLEVLGRFAHLLKAINPSFVYVAATAAVRRATNGAEFAHHAEQILGYQVHVLPAEEEARLISLGITRFEGKISGIVADLGGGSIEIVHVDKGKSVNMISLNIGHLTSRKPSEIKRAIKEIGWLKQAKGLPLYGIGGSFRAIGSAYISRQNYPLPLLHGLEIDKDDVLDILSSLISSPADMTGVPVSRQTTILPAAVIIKHLVKASGISELIVSGTSIRDGLMADIFPQTYNHGDPLLLACGDLARESQRADGLSEALAALLAPIAAVFKHAKLGTIRGSHKQFMRMVEAACLLSDICWNEPSDLRGQLACSRILALPVFSLTHIQRAWLAKAVYHRYVGTKPNKAQPILSDTLLARRERFSAKVVGLGMRFGQNFCGGVPEYLSELSVRVEANKLICSVPEKRALLMDMPSQRRFAIFAESCRLKPVICYH